MCAVGQTLKGRKVRRYRVKPAAAVRSVLACHPGASDATIEFLSLKYYWIKPSTARGARLRLARQGTIEVAAVVNGRRRWKLTASS